jgi:hypothetical protein
MVPDLYLMPLELLTIKKSRKTTDFYMIFRLIGSAQVWKSFSQIEVYRIEPFPFLKKISSENKIYTLYLYFLHLCNHNHLFQGTVYSQSTNNNYTITLSALLTLRVIYTKSLSFSLKCKNKSFIMFSFFGFSI